MVEAAAGNSRSGKEVMALLLKQRGEEAVIAAAQSGKEVTALFEQQGGEVKVTEEVVKAAAGNRGNGKDIMTLLLNQ